MRLVIVSTSHFVFRMDDFFMSSPPENNEDFSICPREEIAAYIDGELSSREEMNLDLHLSNCKTCLDELNSQKKVSTTLEILLEDKADDFELPANFTKIITAKAESNVSGLRQPKERLSAFIIFAVLIALVIVGLGSRIDTIWFAFEKIAGQILVVGGFIWHTILDIGKVFSVILRALSQHFIYSSVSALLLILIVFGMTALMLSKMVWRFNRS